MTQKIEILLDDAGRAVAVRIGGHNIEDVAEVTTGTDNRTTLVLNKPAKITKPYTGAIITKDEPRPRRAKTK